MPPLSTLKAFEAVARLGSVNRAADELGRTHGAVSKQIRALQDNAGVALFDRIGTGLRANDAGRRLAAAVAQALGDLSEAYGEVTHRARAPDLTVACSATFAMGWLAPRLPRFSEAHPEVPIRLLMTSAREMREERDADLVVLWDRNAYSPVDQARAIRLADAQFAIVAAPGYPATWIGAARLEAPCRILHAHTASAWTGWSRLTGVQVVAPATLAFPHTHMCIGAAAAGMGIAIVERRLTAAAIAQGRLQRLSEPVAFPDGFAVLPHARRPMSHEAEQFVAWLRTELLDPV